MGAVELTKFGKIKRVYAIKIFYNTEIKQRRQKHASNTYHNSSDKSWIRTVYSWVHSEHIDDYLSVFSFKINRSIYNYSIFHKIIERVVVGEHIGYKKIIANK